jgi:hypothetical protein
MFKKLLGPEKYAEIERYLARRKERSEELKKLDSKQLADKLEYCLINCTTLMGNNTHQLTTYEDALVQVYLPELLRRLRGEENIQTRYNYREDLQKRVLAQKKLDGTKKG